MGRVINRGVTEDVPADFVGIGIDAKPTPGFVRDDPSHIANEFIAAKNKKIKKLVGSGSSGPVSYSLYDAYSGSYPYTGKKPLLVVVGDSNSIGGPNAALAGYTATSDVRLYDTNTGNFAQNYEPGVFAGLQDPVLKLPNYSTEGQFAKNWVADFPGKRLNILKVGYGGTTLADNWKPTANFYTAIDAHLTNAVAALNAEGGDPVEIVGVIFHCSTNDAGDATKAAAFSANALAFLNNFRTDWGIPATAPLCWIRQKPFDTKPYWQTVLDAQNIRVPAANNCYLISAHDAPGDQDGDIHFGQWGQRLLGARCYRRIIGGRYTLQELSGPSILNPNFDTSMDYWSIYNNTVAATWDATGKLAFPATIGGEVTGWTANLTPGQYYLIDYVATGLGTDFSLAGTKQTGNALSANRQLEGQGTIGFKADNSSQGVDLYRLASAAGASTFDNFTIRQATVDAANAITNGDFSSGTGWTLTNAAISGGGLVVTNGGGGTFAERTFGPLVDGAAYELEVVVSAWTSGTFNTFISGDGATNIGGLGGAVGTTKQVFHANGAYSSITIQGAYVGTIDNIALRRLV